MTALSQIKKNGGGAKSNVRIGRETARVHAIGPVSITCLDSNSTFLSRATRAEASELVEA